MTYTRALSYLWYPCLMTAAVAAFALMAGSGLPLGAATYLPVFAVAVAILTLERQFPERLAWRPGRSDIRADAAFMALVQVALPNLLAALSLLALSEWMHVHSPSAWWPLAWPLAAQVLAMVLLVDLARYWLHRACHRFALLWRFHEVHHSPEILYALNVGRFHPFEKALHYSLDTVPFLLLGVAPEVIAGYFLLYSANGFFQHSNLRLRYGWLNYIVGSAETHRWHHARDPRRAACNFGNTTIVWDLLFGTWYLPGRRAVDEIGVMNRAYPKGFLAQMVVPFRRGENTAGRIISDAVVAIGLRLARLQHGRRIATIARDPMRAQYALLSRIIRGNQGTTFGREHGFAGIEHYEDFRDRVPVRDFEALRPYVEAQLHRGEKVLTNAEPMRYVRTSGTTGVPKDIPLTAEHLDALLVAQRASVAFQYRTCPEAFAGGIVAIVSPAFEGTLAGGKPYGSASGIVAGSTPAAVQAKFVLPAPVLAIGDSHLKYLTILRLAIGRPDISYIGAANSTTLLSLIKLYRQHETELIADLQGGTFFLDDRLPQEARAAIAPGIAKRRERAAELERLRLNGSRPRIGDLWPELRLVVTWTCASAGVTVAALRTELAPRTRVLELGYVASEFRGTITLGRRAGSGFPAIDSHFFEFVERDRWDRGEAEFLTLDRIRKGVDYYIVMTTLSGLYRYFMNDLVRVRGFLHRTPLLQFLQKGKGVTNITGEKLYESQVLAAVSAAMPEIGCLPRFVMMLADEDACRYCLYVEAAPGPKPEARILAALVDAKLRHSNVEYQAKRESERLGPPEAKWLAPETFDAYKRHCVAQGQREGQFKTVALAYQRGFSFDLGACLEKQGR